MMLVLLLLALSLVAVRAHAAPFAYVPNFADTTLSVIDTATRSVVSNIPVGTDPSNVAFTSDGSTVFVAVSGENLVKRYSAAGSFQGGYATGPDPLAVAVSPAGDRLYAGFSGLVFGTPPGVDVYNIATGSLIATIPVPQTPQEILVSRDGARVYVSSNTGALSVIDAATNAVITTLPIADAFGMSLDDRGGRLYVTTTSGIVAISTATETVIREMGTTQPPFNVVVNGAGTRAYAIEPTQVEVFDTARFTRVATIPVPAGFGGDIDRADRYLYVTDDVANAAYVVDLASDTIVATLATGAKPEPVGPFIAPDVPQAPSAVTASAGNGAATISFLPPTLDGGSTITSYTASCGTQSASGSGSPLIVTGLVNGTSYACTVTATNPVGVGPASSAATVTPTTIPDPPTSVTATAGDGRVTVAFSPPASDGGSPIVSYAATCGAQSATGTGSPIVVAGLADGAAVTCTVTATSAMGTSAPSAPSASVTPLGVPGAPTGVSAAPGPEQLTVSFTPPASNGGTAIVSYTAACGSRTASGSSSPIAVTGLADGVPVSCTVSATNAVGNGPASAPSASVAPSFKTFTGPVATGAGLATVTLSGGGAACNFATLGTSAADSAFFIAVTGSPKSPPAGVLPATFPFGLLDFVAHGCGAGSALTLTVTYPGALPAGAIYWKYGPTAAQPTPHWYPLPATISGNTVSFTIVDGGLGDDDLVANGTVADQGGPGTPGGASGNTSPVPTLGAWALAALALLLAGAGMATMHRRR